MALAGIVGGIWVGLFPTVAQGDILTLLSLRIDASGERVAFLVSARLAGTLDSVEFLLGTVTTAADLKVSFQDLDSAGLPDGVADQFSVVSSGSLVTDGLVAPSVMTSDGTGGGTKRTVTLGQRLAIVIEFNSAIGNVDIRTLSGYGGREMVGPNAYHRVGGAWTRYNSRFPILSMLYSSGTYLSPFGCYPLRALSTSGIGQSVSTATTPDEVGVKFAVPSAGALTGLVWHGQIANTADYSVVIYDMSDVVVASISQDANQRVDGNPFALWVPIVATLAADTYYRAIIKPVTTGVLRFGYYTVEAASRAQWQAGSNSKPWMWTQRTDAGAWTDTPTRWPLIELQFASAEANAYAGTPPPGVIVGGGASPGGLLLDSPMEGAFRTRQIGEQGALVPIQSILWTEHFFRPENASASLMPGAKWYTYLAGGATPTDVYQDVGLTTPHAWPVVADAGGLFPPVWLAQGVRYKRVLKTSADVSIPGGEVDGIGGGLGFDLLSSTTVWNPASLADGAVSADEVVVVTGASVGDQAWASFTGITMGKVQLMANVTAANTVTVNVRNVSGGVLDLPSGLLTVTVLRAF